MNRDISQLYDFVLMQMAAEAYFENINLSNRLAVAEQLQLGTNRPGYNNQTDPSIGRPDVNDGWPVYTRMTSQQAAEFVSRFEILHQWSDNPTPTGTRPAPEGNPAFARLNAEILANTGMSATLIRDRERGTYTLAMRSTEYNHSDKGGDGERDKLNADFLSIAFRGFALAQLDALEHYYAWLKNNGKLPHGAVLNVTGYSLGGHLATVFTEIHQHDPDIRFGETVTFNGAGRGRYDATEGSLADMLALYRQVLHAPASVLPLGANDNVGLELRALAIARGSAPFDAEYVYDDPRYRWATYAVTERYGLGWQPLSDENRTGTAADDRITQVFGYETIDNVDVVSNSGVHGPALRIGVESQPLIEGFPMEDYGSGHSIVLIADSLALQRALHRLDPTFTTAKFIDLLPSASRADVDNGSDATYEFDALENILDGLRRQILGPQVSKTHAREGAGGFGDWQTRNDSFFANLEALERSEAFQRLEGKVVIDALGQGDLRASLPLAERDFGWIGALTTLSPIRLRPVDAAADPVLEAHWSAVFGERFDAWKRDRTLTPAMVQAGRAEFGPEWLKDRADLLYWTLEANTRNAANVVLDPPSLPGNVAFRDDVRDTGVTVYGNWVDPSAAPALSHVRFGTDAADAALEGGASDDRLYGMGGRDVLRGGAGDDYLEGGHGDDELDGGAGDDVLTGGKGFDRYVLRSGEGFDTIRDADGAGEISIDGRRLAVGAALGFGVYVDASGTIRFRATGNLATGGTLSLGPYGTVRGFRNGDFGLTLPDQGVGAASPFVNGTNLEDFDTEPSSEAMRDNPLITPTEGPDAYEFGPEIVPRTLTSSFLGGDDAVIGLNQGYGGRGADLLVGRGPDTRIRGDLLVYAGSDLRFVLGGDIHPIYHVYDGSSAQGGTGIYWLPVLDRDQERVLSPDFAPFGDEVISRDLSALLRQVIGVTLAEVANGELDDTIVGSGAEDRFWGDFGSDQLYGGGGNDTLFGDGIFFGIGEEMSANTGARTIRSIAVPRQALAQIPQDWPEAQRRSRTLGLEQDIMGIEFSGDDILYGGTGHDWLIDNHGGSDLLVGGDGTDLLENHDPAYPGRVAYNTLIGGTGDDYLRSSNWMAGGFDRLYGGDGADVLHLELPRGYVDGGPGSDMLSAWWLPEDVVTGVGLSADSLRAELYGGPGDDWYAVDYQYWLESGLPEDQTFPVGEIVIGDGSGADRLSISTRRDALRFAREGEDLIVRRVDAQATVRWVDFFRRATPVSVTVGEVVYSSEPVTGAGSSASEFAAVGFVRRSFGRDGVLPQTLSRTELLALTAVILDEDTPQTAEGGAGDDLLRGGRGDDRLRGGPGADALVGGPGADRYVFHQGDGVDTILDDDGANVLEFGPGITPDMLSLALGSLLVRVGSGGDAVRVLGFDPEDPFAARGIQEFHFADGQILTLAALLGRGIEIAGTAGEDSLLGTAAFDRIAAGADDDVIDARAGDDIVNGGAGHDELTGGAGDDLLLGDGRVAVPLTVFARGQALGGIAPRMEIHVDGRVLATFDVAPTATFQPYAIAHEWTVGAAHRVDVVFANDAYDATTREDRNLFVREIRIGDTVFAPNGAGVQYDRGAGSRAFDGVDVIAGQSGMYWGGALRFGLDGALFGEAGDDWLDGGAGSDRMEGGRGDDWYRVDSTADVVVEHAGEGWDSVAAEVDATLPDHVEALYMEVPDRAGSGNAAANLLYGSDGRDVLSGGLGTDALRGWGGDDVLVGDRGTRPVTLLVRANGTVAQGVGPRMEVRLDGAVVGTFDVTPGIDRDYAVTLHADADRHRAVDVVFVNDAYFPDVGQDRNLVVRSVVFDGRSMDPTQASYDRGAGALAFDGADVVAGRATMAWNGALRFGFAAPTGLSDLLDGGAGDDVLDARHGADVVAGGGGNDTVRIGTGETVLLFNRRDGADRVEGRGAAVLSLGGGLGISDVGLAREGNALVVDLREGDRVSFADWFEGSGPAPSLTIQTIESPIWGDAPRAARYTFDDLVAEFQAAHAGGTAADLWRPMQAQLDAHVTTSDAEAIGGDVAAWYALRGGFDGLSWDEAQAVLAGMSSGRGLQPLQGVQLQPGSVML